MYKDHPAFEKPIDESVKIWRYMDFSKFVYMLKEKALFFASPNLFDDRFEGTITDLYIPKKKK